MDIDINSDKISAGTAIAVIILIVLIALAMYGLIGLSINYALSLFTDISVTWKASLSIGFIVMLLTNLLGGD